MTEGDFVSFAIYNAMVIGPVRRLGRVISEMSKAGVSVARIGEILDAPVEQDAADAQESPMDGNIVFDHVTFRYETGPDVLHDVSFTIPAGSSFGVLGGTGSGKSSLLLMLCKLYAPSEGRVTVGGVDLARDARCVGARACGRRASGAVPVFPDDRGEHRRLRCGRSCDPRGREDGLYRGRHRGLCKRI